MLRSRSPLASLLFCAVCFVCTVLTSCGSSGGGDGGSSDTGSLSLSIDPQTLVVDGVAFVEADFSGVTYDDLDTEGLTMKLLVPNHLELVVDSAALTVETGAVQLKPVFAGHAPDADVQEIFRLNNVETAPSLREFQFSYYVFSLTPSVLHGADHGRLNLQFHVVGKPTTPVILADIDRGAISKFDASDPNFDAEASAEFTVNNETRSSE
ncbi:MAG: hypothetical protein U0136_14770 [Bdellovibrionota bacterium]